MIKLKVNYKTCYENCYVREKILWDTICEFINDENCGWATVTVSDSLVRDNDFDLNSHISSKLNAVIRNGPLSRSLKDQFVKLTREKDYKREMLWGFDDKTKRRGY